MDERDTLKSRIDTLAMVYGVLFAISLVLLGANWLVFGHTPVTTLLWALSLGGAVMTRLYRTSLVNRYNALISGGTGPLT
jgi:hypothetical protein